MGLTTACENRWSNEGPDQNEWQNPDVACVLGKVGEGAFADFFSEGRKSIHRISERSKEKNIKQKRGRRKHVK